LADENVESSYAARQLVEKLYKSWPLYATSSARAAARFRYHNAALAKLAGAELPLELITGKSFVLDADKKTLSMPDDPLIGKI
jgi:hypothetical protein|tara:strand:- start:5968 stop:6216 length:249 start_codon:yes stop_codon:yes gene_type:complete